MASSVVLLSSLVLASCGGDRDEDQGSKTIAKCSPGHTAGIQPIMVSPDTFGLGLREAVDELLFYMPATDEGVSLVNFSGYESLEQKRSIEAGKAVFHIDNEGDLISGPDEFMIQNETKIDDPSEQLCSEEGKFYPTTQAKMAIDRLQELGIEATGGAF